MGSGGRFEGAVTERSAPSPRGAAPEPARPHPFPKRPEESRGQNGQKRAGVAVGGEGRRPPARSRGEFGRWPSPAQKALSDGIPPAESHILCALQKGCGDPERAPRKHAAAPASGGRACQSVALRRDGRSGNSPVRWD